MLSLTLARLRRGGPRLALFLAGALVIGLGLSFFASMVETTRWRVTQEMEGRWQTACDILVRPAGSTAAVEREYGLIEANHVTATGGGISFSQLERISGIPGVGTAAPLCVLGTTSVIARVIGYKLLTGFFRVHWTVAEDALVVGKLGSGTDTVYAASLPPGVSVDHSTLSCRFFDWPYGQPTALLMQLPVTLAAIDPQAEADLVGLNAAVVEGRYFDATDPVTWLPGSPKTLRLPVLVSSSSCSDARWNATLERLPLPPTQQGATKFSTVSRDWLDGLPGQVGAGFTYDDQHFRSSIYKMLNTDPDRPYDLWLIVLPHQPGPRNYVPPRTGEPDNGPTPALAIKPVAGSSFVDVAYRHPQPVSGATGGLYDVQRIVPMGVGLFDPRKLLLGTDPLTELPMETYRPIKAHLVRNAAGDELPGPLRVYSFDPLQGLLTQPAAMLTTLEAARELYGEACISAVRVRVNRAGLSGPAGQARVEAVAKEIFARTGLAVDVTYGSSPTRTVIYVDGLSREEARAAHAAWMARLRSEPPPDSDTDLQIRWTQAPQAPPEGGVPALGFIEEPWIKKGVHISIVRELDRGNIVVLGAVLLVALVFVLCSTMVSVLARRSELGILSALGWRSRTVLGLVVGEPLLAGGLAAMVGMNVAVLTARRWGLQLPAGGVLATGGLALAVYGIGALLPGLAARRTPPLEAMRRGELTAPTSGRDGRSSHAARLRATPLMLALSSVRRRWGRNLLVVLGIGISTVLLAAFTVVTQRMQGVLYGTLLGDYLVWKVGPQHFALAGVSLAVAALATADLLSLGVTERRGELAILQSVGWRPTALRRLLLNEGALLGLLGGLGGSLATAAGLSAWYGSPLAGTAFVCLMVVPVPVIVGTLGALPAAGLALRQSPAVTVRWA